ncbi:unnamed protein product [Amoebophrya sp. A25]|nr:unnamed protein product [Amoebophrya sp. A25]|eukprot:GSA25T00010562001.1
MREMPREERFLYGTHYSTPAYVLYFLVRKLPECMLRLHSGSFDSWNRLFHSVETTHRATQDGTAVLMELIPEFFLLPPDCDNCWLKNFLGIITQDGLSLQDVILPPWAEGSVETFLLYQRAALESEYVSQRLPQWIDLIFGHLSRGENADRADNLFHPVCYLTAREDAGRAAGMRNGTAGGDVTSQQSSAGSQLFGGLLGAGSLLGNVSGTLAGMSDMRNTLLGGNSTPSSASHVDHSAGTSAAHYNSHEHDAFSHGSYRDLDVSVLETQVEEFGRVPFQLFAEAHPPKLKFVPWEFDRLKNDPVQNAPWYVAVADLERQDEQASRQHAQEEQKQQHFLDLSEDTKSINDNNRSGGRGLGGEQHGGLAGSGPSSSASSSSFAGSNNNSSNYPGGGMGSNRQGDDLDLLLGGRTGSTPASAGDEGISQRGRHGQAAPLARLHSSAAAGAAETTSKHNHNKMSSDLHVGAPHKTKPLLTGKDLRKREFQRLVADRFPSAVNELVHSDRYVYAVGDDGCLRSANLQTGVVRGYHVSPVPLKTLALLSDDLVLLGGCDNVLSLFNTKSGCVLDRNRTSHADTITCLATGDPDASGNGTASAQQHQRQVRIVSGSIDQTVAVMEVTNSCVQLLSTFDEPDEPISAVAADGISQIACGTVTGKVCLFDARAQHEYTLFFERQVSSAGTATPAQATAFDGGASSPTSTSVVSLFLGPGVVADRQLAAVDRAGNFRVWDVRKETEVLRSTIVAGATHQHTAALPAGAVDQLGGVKLQNMVMVDTSSDSASLVACGSELLLYDIVESQSTRKWDLARLTNQMSNSTPSTKILNGINGASSHEHTFHLSNPAPATRQVVVCTPEGHLWGLGAGASSDF